MPEEQPPIPPPSQPEPVPPAPPTPPNPGGHLEHYQNPVVPSTPLAPATPARPRRSGKILVIVIATLVILAGAGALAYQQIVIAPRQALSAYFAKAFAAKTASFGGTAAYNSSNADQKEFVSDFKFSGKYDITNTKDPKVVMGIQANFGSASLTADLITLSKTLYFKVGGQVLQNFGVSLTQDWYKLKFDDNIIKDKCLESGSSKSGNYLGFKYIKDIPVQKAQRVGVFETVNGHRTTHFRGLIDNAKIEGVVEKANKDLPAECKISLPPNTYKNTELAYDLWAGQDFDRIQFKITETKTKSVTTLTIDTSSYNQPVEIKPPANAKEINNIFDAFAATEEAAPSPVNARDSQRKSDMRSIRNALETYFSDHNSYPATLGILEPDYLKSVPKDPSTGQNYTYKPAKDLLSYTLSATLENKSDTQSQNGVYTLHNVQ